jgi:type VII secretion integral membrane protein EccD
MPGMANGTAVAGSCRLVVRGPATAFELAVPTDVQIVDLLPTIVGYAGDGLDESALDHGGWVLQRLGGAALDEDGTAETIGLHDGDVLYLRPRREQLAPIHFDDLVDGVATTLRERADSWGPAWTRRVLAGQVLAALGTGLALLALPGPRGPRAAAAVLVAAVLTAGAASAARAIRDTAIGAVLALAALPYLALTAALLPTGTGTATLGTRLLAGGGAAAGLAALALAVVGAYAPLFLAAALAAVNAAVGGALMAAGVPPGRAAAAVAVLAVVWALLTPMLGFHLSGLRLPPLPANAQQLQEGIEPHAAGEVLARGALAGRYVSAFYVAIGAVYAAGLTGLWAARGWPSYALTGALGLLALLHGRSVGGVAQKLAMVLPGAYGLVTLAVRLGADLAPQTRPALAAVALAVAALAVAALAVAAASAAAAWSPPGRRALPHWGYLADLLHSLAAIALLPLALMVFGLYHTLRGLG